MDARVVSLDHSGAWVDVGETRAFVPLAEIAWFEIEHPSAMLAAGDWIRAKVTGQMKEGHWECSVRRVESDGPDA